MELKIKNELEEELTKREREEKEKDEDGIIYITNYYKTLEQLINKFNKNFDNETVFCKFYF